MPAPHLSVPILEQYGIGVSTGFLPSTPPPASLPLPYYAPWEDIAKNIPTLVREKRIRPLVNQLPLLETSYLQSRQEHERAHSVLAFLLHAYVWGSEDVATVVPPPLSIPFTNTCRTLNLPPVAIYAGVVLWNYSFINESLQLDFSDPTNLRAPLTFTGLPDESWFYMISAAIEARGAPIILDGLQALQSALQDDCDGVIETLHRFRAGLDDIANLFDRMYDGCSPEHFCNSIRRFLSGWTKIASEGPVGDKGLTFDMGDGGTSYVASSCGPSNAQCSLIQFFDLSLGVDHRSKGKAETSEPAGNYLHEMRKYMPLSHRAFLDHVEQIPNLRHFVQLHPSNDKLVAAYDDTIAGLTNLRDRHLQMVLKYMNIGEQSKTQQEARADMASSTPADSDPDTSTAKGTGGTHAVPFLKQTRANTTNANSREFIRGMAID